MPHAPSLAPRRRSQPTSRVGSCNPRSAFTSTDALAALAALCVLVAVALPLLSRSRATARFQVCHSNLGQVGKAVLSYAHDNKDALPNPANRTPGGWWWYKESVKKYVGLTGASSAADKVFGCPEDRGYAEEGRVQPFRTSAKFNYTSYVLNSVNLPGIPNIAGRKVATIIDPSKTLLVMEWSAHAPLSWHRSKTGRNNWPFYNDAESMVTFVDGRTKFIKIYYDGINAAFTRDPIPGYDYKYSGD